MANYQYFVGTDDRWDNIAYKAYGGLTMENQDGVTISAIETITDANPDVMITPIVAAGTVLNIPIVSDNQQSINTAQVPPWG